MLPKRTRFEPGVSATQLGQFHYLQIELELLGSELLREIVKKLVFLVEKKRGGYQISHQKDGQKEILDIPHKIPEESPLNDRLQFSIYGIVSSSLRYLKQELPVTKAGAFRQALSTRVKLLQKKKDGWKLVIEKDGAQETIILL